MKIDSYLITSIAGGSNLIAQSGSKPKYARAIKLVNITGTVTLGGLERGTFPMAANAVITMDEVNRAGQAGKISLAEVILRGVGTTQVLLIDPSDE